MQKSPQQAVPALLIQGDLILEDGYLRLKTSNNVSYLLIWPVGYTWKQTNDKENVIDKDGIIKASVGDYVALGGGEAVSQGIVKIYTGEDLPQGAKAPYWLVLNIESIRPPANK